MALKIQDLRISTRVALALALPMAGLFALSIWIVANYHRTANDMGRLRKLTEIAPAIGSAVHAIQIERGLSATTLGASGKDFVERLPGQYLESDAARQELNRRLDGLDAGRLGGNLRNRIPQTRELLGQIETWRRAVAERTITVHEVIGRYSGAITELIGIIEETRLFGSSVEVNRTISAYTNIMHAKELAGLERAIGTTGFAEGGFDRDSHARFIQLIERQRLYHEEFWLYAAPEQAALLDRAFATFDSAELERMRRIAIRGNEAIKASGVDAAHWFAIGTRKINLLKTVEDRIGGDLIAQVRRVEDSARQTAWWISALAAVLVIMTVLLASILARGIIQPLTRITNSMSKLAARDQSIEIEDNRRADEIGDMTRALIIFRDNLVHVAQAGERIKNEAILRLHHEALGAISQGVLITDARRRITYANQAFQRITGYTEDEILGVTPSFLHNRDSDSEILAELRNALASGRHFQGQLLNHRKDGSHFWCDLSINPVLDKSGRPTHFVGVTRDITENRLMQQELRIAATAFESLHGIMVTDANGIILRVNHAFTEMTGYSAAEVVGQTPAILKSGHHEPEFFADMWHRLATTGGWYGEVWDRRKNGEIFPKWQTISAVMGVDGTPTHYVAAFSDISESKAAEDEIKTLAFYDPLTKLPNRRLLLDRLQHALATSARNQRNCALLFIDLDNFKNLNDTFGHDKGDLLLQQVGGRLANCVRDGDTVARFGGDEFVLMLEDLSGNPAEAASQTELVADKILDTLNQPYRLAGHEYHGTPSIGVALFCGPVVGVDELLKQADLAMYQAKAAGRNTVRFFQAEMEAAIAARSTLETDLRQALRDRQFLLFYQPQVSDDGRLTGVEALLRWRHPTRGLVLPNEFIPMTEETGLVLPLGLWVLETACAQLAVWALDPTMARLTIAVNVSARQFNHKNFVDQVLATLEHTGADARRLKIELTESLFLDNIDEIVDRMTRLKSRGVRFALDDFGTGYSSLSYLKRLPLDQLKIDKSFIKDLDTNPDDAAIARMIIVLAESMGLEVLAEGVETQAQRDFVIRQGCHAHQGFLFSRPLPLAELEDFARGG